MKEIMMDRGRERNEIRNLVDGFFYKMVLRTLYIIHSVQYTVYSTQCTVHTTQCTVHTTQCTVHTTQCSRTAVHSVLVQYTV